MYTKRKGIKSKKHRHSVHHPRHRHSIHHRKRSSTKAMYTRRKNKRKTRRTRKHHRHMNMSGGMSSYPNAHIPDANNSFNNGLKSLGDSYNAGVTGQPSGNHYAFNTNVKAAPMPSNPEAIQTGGNKSRCNCKGKCNKRCKCKHKCNHKCKCKCKNKHTRIVQRGGGLSSFMSSIVPEDLLNIGRSVPSAIGHLADKFNGELSHPSSMVYPTQQPHVYDKSNSSAFINPSNISTADIKAIYNDENNRVSGL